MDFNSGLLFLTGGTFYKSWCAYHCCFEWMMMRTVPADRVGEVFSTRRQSKVLHLGLIWCTMLMCFAMEVVFLLSQEIVLQHKLHFTSFSSFALVKCSQTSDLFARSAIPETTDLEISFLILLEKLNWTIDVCGPVIGFKWRDATLCYRTHGTR